MRAAIRLAGGREVCFVCTLDDERHRADGARRRARRRRAACSRCPGSRAAARCSCTTIRRACSSRRARTIEIAARMHDDGIGFGDRQQPGDGAVRRRRSAVARRVLARWSSSAIDDDLGPDGVIAAAPRALRGSSEPARDGGRDRAPVQRRRRRPPRGGNRRRQIARLPRSRAALGRGERRAHGRVDEHDQPAGAARRKGPAVPRATRCATSRFASRCSKGGATISASCGSSSARSSGNALFEDGVQQELDTIHAVVASERATDRSATSRPRRAPRSGTRSRPSRTSASALSVRAVQQVLPVQGAPRSGAGGRHRRESPPAAVRPRRAPRVGNWGEAAVLPAYTRLVDRRRAPPRGRGGDAPWRDRLAPFAAASVQSARASRRKGLLTALIGAARRCPTTCSAPRASISCIDAPAPAGARGRARRAALLFDLLETFLQESGESVRSADRRLRRRIRSGARGCASRSTTRSARSSSSPTDCSSCASVSRARSGSDER